MQAQREREVFHLQFEFGARREGVKIALGAGSQENSRYKVGCCCSFWSLYCFKCCRVDRFKHRVVLVLPIQKSSKVGS